MSGEALAIETVGLAKRYRSTWDRFWPVQGVESGLFLVLALALSMLTYWCVTTREA